MISKTVDDRRHELAALFQEAKPFRHVVIDGFLEPVACQSLLDAFPEFENRYALNEMGKVGDKAVRTDVGNLTGPFNDLDARIKAPEFLDLIAAITGIPDLRYDPDYIGGGTHENRHGQGLAPHVDFNILPGRRWHRRLNLIIYLNPVWEESWGGCIELHSNPWKPRENVSSKSLPLFNRCVLFETNEVSWHGFEIIRLPEAQRKLSRKSFAIYLYTDSRPDQETAPAHATIYVPEGMPKALLPGTVLDKDWHGEIERRFDFLQGQLKFLYDRESQFSVQLEHAQTALAEAQSRLWIGLQGYAVQHETTGYWPDGWVGRELRVGFTPSVAAKALELSLWAPEDLPMGQEVELELGPLVRSARVGPGKVVKIDLELAMPAGLRQELVLRSRHALVPSGIGDSQDDRELCLQIALARLLH